MANVDWTDPGTDGRLEQHDELDGAEAGASYPGQFAAAGDIVTIGASNSALRRHLQCPECDH